MRPPLRVSVKVSDGDCELVGGGERERALLCVEVSEGDGDGVTAPETVSHGDESVSDGVGELVGEADRVRVIELLGETLGDAPLESVEDGVPETVGVGEPVFELVGVGDVEPEGVARGDWVGVSGADGDDDGLALGSVVAGSACSGITLHLPSSKNSLQLEVDFPSWNCQFEGPAGMAMPP